ncbi:MAG: hypothetical protein PSX37_05210 [bacterium]|nr:hypothetical protein [bacterium]
MTTTSTCTYRCPICEHASEHERIRSSSQFGSRDLDLRPPEMFRGTINLWLVECPRCFYVSNGDDGLPEGTEAERAAAKERHGPFISPSFLSGEVITEVRLHSPFSALAKKFMRRSFIDEHLGRLWIAGYHSLSAAWACDDEFRDELAIPCRLRTAQLIRDFLERSEPDDDTPTVRLVLMDVLRRAGKFDEAREQANALAARRNLHEREFGILRFQCLLIDNQVRSGDTIAAAFR